MVGVAVLNQAFVVARERDDKEDGVDAVKDVDPLTALAPLAADVDDLVARMSLSVGAKPDAQKRLAFWTRYSRLVASQQVPKSSDSLHGRIALRWQGGLIGLFPRLDYS